MKKFGFFVFACVAIFAAYPAAAQFKSQVQEEAPASTAILRQDDGSALLGWFDPSKFTMQQSVSFSYMTMGGQGMSIGTYTNSMRYQFSDKVNARADVSLMYSPFASSGLAGMKSNSLSSIYLSRAEVNYKPWDNVMVQLQYRQVPWGYYPYGSPFMYPW